MKNVVFGLLGTQKDLPNPKKRHKIWRPTVSLALQENFPLTRYDLIYAEKIWEDGVKQLVDDVAELNPQVQINSYFLPIVDIWDFEEVYAALFDFLKGYHFDTKNEEYFANISTSTHVVKICWFLFAEARHLPGRLIQSRPPEDGPEASPLGTYNIIDLDLSKYDQIAKRFKAKTDDAVSLLKGGIITKNEAFNTMIARIEQVAIRSREPILLTGPTGAGKSSLAERIHALKIQNKQITGPLVQVNCATIRGAMSMSTLFGHTKGSFTGASEKRSGLLCEADKGILFLDEIGELGPDEQGMLLRALEAKKFLPVGGDKEVSSDFLLIGGTNRDLLKDVARGKFRKDLLARINLWSFELPALKDRPEDIEPNIEHELERHRIASGKYLSFSREARARFLQFAMEDAVWSGNFRDLGAAVTRMVTLCDDGRITKEIVEEEIKRLQIQWKYEQVDFESRRRQKMNVVLKRHLGERASELDDFDRVQLAHVLLVCEKSKTLAAAGRKLFSSSRERRKKTNDTDRLRKYLAKYGIMWDNSR